jgi:hypothetical protein
MSLIFKRSKRSGIIVSRIPRTLPEPEIIAFLHTFGATEHLKRLPSNLDDPDTYSLKANYFDPARARRARIGVRQRANSDSDPRWKRISVRKSPWVGSADASHVLPASKCATLLNEVVGPLGWSTSIVAMRTAPPPRRPRPPNGNTASAADLGLFVLERSALALPHGILDVSDSLRRSASESSGHALAPIGEPDSSGMAHDDYGAEFLEPQILCDAAPPTALPPLQPSSSFQFSGHSWTYIGAHIPSIGLPLALPPLLCSGERKPGLKPPKIVPRNFADPEPPPASSRAISGATVGACGGGRGGRGVTSAARELCKPAVPPPRSVLHSCVLAKVSVLVHNPDGSVTQSIGQAGCDCAPASSNTRFEAVTEALTRIEQSERLVAMEASLRPIDDVTGASQAADGASHFAAVLRPPALSSGAVSDRCDDGSLRLSSWHPAATSAHRAAASAAWKGAVVATEEGERGFHLKRAIAAAQCDAFSALELITL